jgi:hypothetical protein
METIIKNNCIFIDNVQVSNFTISKIGETKTGEGVYEIDNGEHKEKGIIENRNLTHFRRQIYRYGMFIFMGNTKHLNVILNSLADPKHNLKQS